MADPNDPTNEDTEANALFTSLIAGANFSTVVTDLSGFVLPAETGPLFGALAPLTNADLTEQKADGTGLGTLDVLMGGVQSWLKEEYAANRISGAEYTKAFIAMTQAAIGGSVQFLLGRDQAYWQAVTAQAAAQQAQVALATARVQFEVAKNQLVLLQAQAASAQAEYALTKSKLSTEAAQYRTAEYTLTNILPAQKLLVSEQAEAQRGQTMDTRSDGITAVAGNMGKQKALYTQQITSYQRDAEVKAAKLFTDAWVTQKTMDDGLVPPMGFTNDSVNTVLTVIMANNDFGAPSP